MYSIIHYYSCANAFKSVFLAKAYCKMVFKSAKKFGSHKFPWQSLLLSSTVIILIKGYYSSINISILTCDGSKSPAHSISVLCEV